MLWTLQVKRQNQGKYVSTCIRREKTNYHKCFVGEPQSIVVTIEYCVCSSDLLMKRKEFSLRGITFGLVGV